MSELIQLLIRHGFMLLSAALAAHHFDNLNTTAGLLLALMCMIICTLWSWVTKMFHLEYTLGKDLTNSDSLRTFLGTVISHGVTFASGYFAIDANDPNVLAVALINMVASRYGVPQQIAHGTPISKAAAVKALMLCGCCLSMASCATTAAFLASPFGQATWQTADQLAKQVLLATERSGLEQIIEQASVKVAALKAQGADSDAVKELLRVSQIAGFSGVIEAAQVKYQQLTGKRFVLPKNPVLPVLP